MYLYLRRVNMDDTPALSRTVQLGILSCQDAQDVTEATQVEGVESTFLMSMQGPWLTAIEERADPHKPCRPGLWCPCQLIIGIHSLWQSGQVCGSLPDAPVYQCHEEESQRERIPGTQSCVQPQVWSQSLRCWVEDFHLVPWLASSLGWWL